MAGSLKVDIQGVWAEPLSVVVRALKKYDTCMAVFENLQDVELYH